MGLEDLTALDATFPKGNIEPVSVLDNYQRETRAKLKAWAAVEHDLVTGRHQLSTLPSYPSPGRMYYDKITSELRYYMNGPPGANFFRSVIQPPFNYVFNPEFKLMSNSYISPPCGWSWSGAAGQSVVQDASTAVGKYSIRLGTPAGGAVPNVLTQAMSTSNPRFLPIDYWRGRTVSFGCYVTSELAGMAFIQLSDGVTGVNSVAQASGVAGWDWCVTTMTVGAGATDLLVHLVASLNIPAPYFTWFAEPTLVEGAWCARPTPQSHPPRSHILTFNTRNGNSQAMTGVQYYGPIGRNANEFLVSVIIPYRYVARNLAVITSAPPGAGQSYDFRVRQNNTIDTSIACLVANTATSAADDINTLQGNANDTLSLRMAGSAAPATCAVVSHLYIDELPW